MLRMNAVTQTLIEETDATLSDLLNRVERGEEVTIARRGRPVACLKPVAPEPKQTEAVLDDLWQLREEIRAERGTISTDEILELIREGRKY